MAFHRSSSGSLLFQAFILVFGTPSEIRQNQTLSEYCFIRSVLRKSRAPALTGLPSLPWQDEQLTSMFLTPSKISLPSAMTFSSAHHPAGMCLSAYSGGAGGGGWMGPSSASHPVKSTPTHPIIASAIRPLIFITALKLLSYLQTPRIKKTLGFRASHP